MPRGRPIARGRRGKPPHSPPQDSASLGNLDIYQKLLEETPRSSDLNQPEVRPLKRPLKRRRIASISEESLQNSERVPAPQSIADENHCSARGSSNDGYFSDSETQQQVIYTSSESSDENDVEWEHLLEDEAKDRDESSKKQEQKDEPISLELKEGKVSKPRKAPARRLPSTKIERQKRIDVHKVHICCLIAHTYVRSAWCNGKELQVSHLHSSCSLS